MKKQYITRILRNEGDEDYCLDFVFPAGTGIDDAIIQLMKDGINYYQPRDVWNQIKITIEN